MNLAIRFALATPLVVSLIIIFLAWLGGHFQSDARILIYGLAPGSLAAGLVWAQFLPPKVRTIIVVNGVALVVAVFAAEIYLSADAISPTRSSDSTDEPLPAGTIPLICSSHISSDGTYISENAGNHKLLPLASISGAKVARLVSDTGDLTYATTDRYGFNNPDYVWDTDETKLLLIGDSFTYGADVAFDGGYSDKLRHFWPNTVNLGCGGNGPLSALATLREFGPLLKPDFIVWGYFEGNDLTKDIDRESNIPILTNYLTSEGFQNLAILQPKIDQLIYTYLEKWKATQTLAAGTKTQLPAPEPTIPWPDILRLVQLRTAIGLSFEITAQSFDRLDMMLKRTKELAASWGGKVIVVHLPAENRWQTVLSNMDASSYTGTVKRIVEANDLQWLSLVPEFEATGNPRALYNGHYTKEGNTLVSTKIKRALVKK